MVYTAEDLKKLNRDSLVAIATPMRIEVQDVHTKAMIAEAILLQQDLTPPNDNQQKPDQTEGSQQSQAEAGQPAQNNQDAGQEEPEAGLSGDSGGDDEEIEGDENEDNEEETDDKAKKIEGDSMKPSMEQVEDPTEGYLKISAVAEMLDEFYSTIKDGDSRRKLNDIKTRLVNAKCFMRVEDRMEQVSVRDPNDARSEELYAIVFSLMQRYCGNKVEIMATELQFAKDTNAEMIAKWKSGRSVLEINIA